GREARPTFRPIGRGGGQRHDLHGHSHPLLSGPRHVPRAGVSRLRERNAPPILIDSSSRQPLGTPPASRERITTMGTQRTRREFFGNVGRGMLVASVGLGTAFDMGLTPAWADDEGGGERLAFGGLEPLVGLMQETPVRDLVPVLVEKLRAGV